MFNRVTNSKRREAVLVCGVLNNVRKPGHSTRWQGYDLQQTIVIGVVSLRRTPSDSPAATSVVGQWSEMVSVDGRSQRSVLT